MWYFFSFSIIEKKTLIPFVSHRLHCWKFTFMYFTRMYSRHQLINCSSSFDSLDTVPLRSTYYRFGGGWFLFFLCLLLLGRNEVCMRWVKGSYTVAPRVVNQLHMYSIVYSTYSVYLHCFTVCTRGSRFISNVHRLRSEQLAVAFNNYWTKMFVSFTYTE